MNVLPLHAGNPGPMTGGGNWTWLLPGPSPLLVDAGVGHVAHLDAIADRAAAGPALVVVTHIHPDHAAGATAISARWPASRFAKWPWVEHDGRIGVAWEPLAAGQRIDSAEGPLEVVHTPGHSPDHVALWHAASRTVFTGDLLVQGSTVVIPASHGGSLTDYLASLARVAALEPARALPAHGPIIDDPLALIARYVEHRRRREQQVLAALGSSPTGLAALVAHIYAGLAAALLPQARDSVLAHLVKLERDGVVVGGDDGWRLR
ncbi:MAG: MBL fold metallo-hydrolase [Vicinamibacterales bacterium]